MVWFNQPYNAEVKTNIGKVFLKLIRKYFHKRHRYKKIFNTNVIKLSYLCTPNVKNLIKQHNSSITKSGTNTNKKDCNCRNKDNCSLDGKCLVKCTVYEATVSTTNQINNYFGSAEGDFKSRYNNHTLSLRSKGYKHRTELSKHICLLKDSNTVFSVKWYIKTKVMPYKCSSQKCDLCLAEKVALGRFEGVGLLNKRTELLSKCRDRNKFIKGNIK